MARLRSNLRQASSTSCTSIVSWMCRSAALLRACCTCVNMTFDPATAGVMLRSSHRSLLHLRRELVPASQGMATRAEATLSHHVGGRRSRCAIVSRSHPSTVFWVDHSPSPCPSFFREMGFFLFVSFSSLQRNTRSIWWKMCHRIWQLSLGPPWTTETKSSR